MSEQPLKFDIKRRWSWEVQFTAVIDCAEDTPDAYKKRLALLWAIENGVDVSLSDFTYADLRKTDLRGTQLRECNFRGADFRDADLTDTDFLGSVLRYCDLRGAIIGGSDLFSPRFNGIDWHGAKADIAPGRSGRVSVWEVQCLRT